MAKFLLILSFLSFFQLQLHSLEHFENEHEVECIQCLLSIDNVTSDNPNNPDDIAQVPKHSSEKVLFHFVDFYISESILVYDGRAPPFIS